MRCLRRRFFYIPGAETCLAISGYAWYQIGATNDEGVAAGDSSNYNFFVAGGWNKSIRARVNFDARSETEWGALRSYIRFEGTWDGQGDGPLGVDQAFVDLGGFRMGYTESAWVETPNGISSYGSHSWNGMWYGYQQRALIQYNFRGTTGIFGTVSLEDDALAGDGYMPDVVGLIGFQQAWGAVWLRAGYDEFYGAGLDGIGVSAGLQYNVGTAGSSFRFIANYADGDHLYGTGGPIYGLGGFGNSEWSLMGSSYHQFSSTLGASVAARYFSDFYTPNSTLLTNLDGYAAEFSIVWTPVTNFEIRTEVQYDKAETLDGALSGYLRFTRYF